MLGKDRGANMAPVGSGPKPGPGPRVGVPTTPRALPRAVPRAVPGGTPEVVLPSTTQGGATELSPLGFLGPNPVVMGSSFLEGSLGVPGTSGGGGKDVEGIGTVEGAQVDEKGGVAGAVGDDEVREEDV
ncbi:unnamed protein product, partial [Discosporangium mesarthrocarpum]